MANKAAKPCRICLMRLADKFPNEEVAVKWFEQVYWPRQRTCGHCGSTNTKHVPHQRPMPYWCTDCRSYFSVRTGTTLEHTRLPLRKWALAVYLFVNHPNGVTSMQLHRDLGITQKTAWFMLHSLQKAWDATGLERFRDPATGRPTLQGWVGSTSLRS